MTKKKNTKNAFGAPSKLFKFEFFTHEHTRDDDIMNGKLKMDLRKQLMNSFFPTTKLNEPNCVNQLNLKSEFITCFSCRINSFFFLFSNEIPIFKSSQLNTRRMNEALRVFAFFLRIFFSFSRTESLSEAEVLLEREFEAE